MRERGLLYYGCVLRRPPVSLCAKTQDKQEPEPVVELPAPGAHTRTAPMRTRAAPRHSHARAPSPRPAPGALIAAPDSPRGSLGLEPRSGRRFARGGRHSA